MITYILDETGNPVVEPDVRRWAEWMTTVNCHHFAFDEIGDIRISTGFLGLDFEFGPESSFLFQTVVVDGSYNVRTTRYATRDAALAGHKRAVAMQRSKADGRDRSDQGDGTSWG